MDEEYKTNGEAEPTLEPVAETPQQNEETDPFAAVETINVPESSEEQKSDYMSSEEPESFSEPAEVSVPVSVPVSSSPQSFDIVKPATAPAVVETPTTVEPAQPKGQKTAETTIVPSATKPKKYVLKAILLIIIVLALAAAAAGAAYMYRDGVAVSAEKQKTDEIAALNTKAAGLQTKLDAEIAKNATTVTAPTSVAPGVAAAANIKASITSGNTAALEGYMATSVNVIIAASEGVGPSTPAVAVSNITTFIADATSPWNFELAASVLSSYGQGSYDQYFPSTSIVGKSANNKVISFGFDANAKINTVFLSSSDSLLE
ncbi:hypothetical protein COV88_00565 [Candidatus Saccharibacteria bacterium CG11_big_fil_rev_8_21_14_0_20_41_19]|nr:hypothetical protein [Candidatus Saccharibacteria bacterium]OIP86156.1 MAG: hypothetical protein AUK57_00040 [Candidatus Saccharibacteria bacterium CG2_30_41_52]PIQ70967.1 MAG: hypothetical protein COV88_00565 [Candidatus Saccharibacteria bacterium CG11_big_fil_rev_8_21_14_0_20_41_19]PIZ60489.1 MAG: hypothetical protein COY18_01390 [Candidatus Saccharibacteria bacterium CG_4_10_14_0_2_um_filter_41_11]PJC29423.1 MAG: hypothetical protein CO052_03455 [Candidatus Saccharibacteria bacterium CG_4